MRCIAHRRGKHPRHKSEVTAARPAAVPHVHSLEAAHACKLSRSAARERQQRSCAGPDWRRHAQETGAATASNQTDDVALAQRRQGQATGRRERALRRHQHTPPSGAAGAHSSSRRPQQQPAQHKSDTRNTNENALPTQPQATGASLNETANTSARWRPSRRQEPAERAITACAIMHSDCLSEHMPLNHNLPHHTNRTRQTCLRSQSNAPCTARRHTALPGAEPLQRTCAWQRSWATTPPPKQPRSNHHAPKQAGCGTTVTGMHTSNKAVHITPRQNHAARRCTAARAATAGLAMQQSTTQHGQTAHGLHQHSSACTHAGGLKGVSPSASPHHHHHRSSPMRAQQGCTCLGRVHACKPLGARTHALRKRS